MSDLKKAYELLGLPENASREEVERVFDIELRKSRSKSSEQDFDMKLKAYKLITGSEDRQKIEEKSRERFQKWGRFAGTAEKVEEFFRIYRTHVIVGIIAVIVLTTATVTFVNHRQEQKRLAALPPIDLSIMYLGNFMSDMDKGGDEGLEQAMLEQFPEWKRLKLTMTYLPSSDQSMGGADMAYQQKAMAILATEKPDIYILDQSSYDWIGGSGVLEKLDEEANGILKPLLNEENQIIGRGEEDTEDHVYAIDITNSKLADQLPLGKQQMIVGLRGGSENRDNAIHFIERYLQEATTK